MSALILNANALHIPLADNSVQCIITSPPYYGLRDYGVDGQLGLEPTPDEYIANLVAVFRECKRILRDDGTLWVNIGDSYASNGEKQTGRNDGDRKGIDGFVGSTNYGDAGGKTKIKVETGLKSKDLIGIPWMLAFALRADGWYLRQDIIWCLSGGTYVYAKTQRGVIPTPVRDLYRLDPSTIQLWNGKKWTRVLGISKNKRCGDEIEIVLRSGERISCTPTHKFPTKRGLVDAGNLVIGDVLETCNLPEVDSPRDCAIDEDAAWFAGLYIAEGSRAGDTIQIAGHSKEIERWNRINKVVAKYGGSCTRTVDGNKMDIRVYGKILNAIIDELVTGRTAKDKGFSPSVWKYSNKFISSMLDGYLSGDGHYDAGNNRWRLGFTRNYHLERDLRTACARLNYHLILNLSTVKYNGKDVPTFRGEIRKERSGHLNEKDAGEIVEIRKARCREVYDIGVEDEPHLFSLASGVLTHNSKPNPMPESVKDRCTKSHEYIFLLSKSAKYYYDSEAVAEPSMQLGKTAIRFGGAKYGDDPDPKYATKSGNEYTDSGTRNKRDVWTVTTKPYKGAHYATFNPELIKPCILAGAPETVCAKCGAPYERVVERDRKARNELPKDDPRYRPNTYHGSYENINGKGDAGYTFTQTTGFQPTCSCNAGTKKGIVFDPFVGSGTTVATALQLGREGIGIDLSMKYLLENAKERIREAKMPLFEMEWE